jgi:hypothetical protein
MLNPVHKLQICAQSVGCAVDACANIDVQKMGGLYIDCVGICNANFTALDAYQNLTCLQVGSSLHRLLLFLAAPARLSPFGALSTSRYIGKEGMRIDETKYFDAGLLMSRK